MKIFALSRSEIFSNEGSFIVVRAKPRDDDEEKLQAVI